MTRSRSELADALDNLARNGRVSLTETRDRLVAYQLLGGEAKSILSLCAAAGWEQIQAEDEGGVLAAELIQDDDFGITVRSKKPGIPKGVEAILTQHGLEAALLRRDLGPLLWVHGLNDAFETATVRFAPWGDTTAFVAQEPIPSPRLIVRVLADGSRFPDDLGRWLLRDAEVPITGRGIQPWRRMAVERLAQSLTDEVEPDGKLLFRGPPSTRFTASTPQVVDASAIEAVVKASKWVFENPREAENRHVLFAAEVARATLQGGDAVDFANLAKPALEGAKIAYNFGVTQQSRDTLKALGDLRKAVSDEAVKLSDSTRALATAIAGAVVANLGIIVARLSIAPNGNWSSWAAIVLGAVLAIYVGSMIMSGAHFLRLQATLRSEWRARLYRFLNDDEYKRMVADPVARAERAFWAAAIIGAIMAALLFIAVLIISKPEILSLGPTPTPPASGQKSG